MKFPLLKFNFSQYSSYLFPKVFLSRIAWNSNEWFSRNRRVSEKAIPYSIAIFLTYYACATCNSVLSHQYTFSNIPLYEKIKTMNAPHSIMKKNSTDSAGFDQTKWSLYPSTPCFFWNPRGCAESHQQERAHKQCSAFRAEKNVPCSFLCIPCSPSCGLRL